jgi:hypothetical protein
MRIALRHRPENTKLLEWLNEDAPRHLRQYCCGCVGFEIVPDRFVTFGITCRAASVGKRMPAPTVMAGAFMAVVEKPGVRF